MKWSEMQVIPTRKLKPKPLKSACRNVHSRGTDGACTGIKFIQCTYRNDFENGTRGNSARSERRNYNFSAPETDVERFHEPLSLLLAFPEISSFDNYLPPFYDALRSTWHSTSCQGEHSGEVSIFQWGRQDRPTHSICERRENPIRQTFHMPCRCQLNIGIGPRGVGSSDTTGKSVAYKWNVGWVRKPVDLGTEPEENVKKSLSWNFIFFPGSMLLKHPLLHLLQPEG